jgi:hypothetical protein
MWWLVRDVNSGKSPKAEMKRVPKRQSGLFEGNEARSVGRSEGNMDWHEVCMGCQGLWNP